jgi:hypothetical protein
MKRILILATVLALSLAALATGAAAAGPNGQAGKSNVGHLYLFEKDPVGWSIIDDGAWGKMNYRIAAPKFRFVFNGHGLEPATDYTLIYYPDPWPGSGAICLGTGPANEDGNVHIAGRTDLNTNLPIGVDENQGAKIWLVLKADVDCTASMMIGWNPASYLFEDDLITYTDTNIP